MSLSFDLSQYYLLFQVFDMTGRAMFRDHWRGSEWDARETPDAQAVRERRDALRERLAEIRKRDRARQIELEGGLTEVERDVLAEEAVQDYFDRDKLRAEIHDLPELSESFLRDSKAFARRRSVEGELISAFRANDLCLVLPNAHIVEWDHWARSDDFRVYWSMSMVRMPLHIMRPRRRAPAMVEKPRFDNWVKRFGPGADELPSLTPEEQCRNWLRGEIAKGRRQTKSEYLAEALALIEGLSERAFNRIWADEVPTSWSAPGPLKL